MGNPGLSLLVLFSSSPEWKWEKPAFLLQWSRACFWYSVKHKSSPSSKTGLIRHPTVWEPLAWRLNHMYVYACVDMWFNCKYRWKELFHRFSVSCLESIYMCLASFVTFSVLYGTVNGNDGFLDEVQQGHPVLSGACANTMRLLVSGVLLWL